MERRKDFSGTTRGVQALLLPMFESAFNIDFRASLHALAYQHVTALDTILRRRPLRASLLTSTKRM